ncbi:hypothetical protein [Streptomyces sp. NPDC048111]|uniref:hypothetical protein n=1 Tax=Streptomyces sp. NPDC048111 TaxID=3365500 RepID=UPI003717A6B6
MHRHIRTAGLTAAGLAAALVLTGCGSGGDGKKAAPAASDAGASGGSGGSGGATVKTGDLVGFWLADDDKDFSLLFSPQKTVNQAGSHDCVGRLDDTDGMTMIRMSECPKGGEGEKERWTGMLKLTNDTLEVTWKGSGKQTFTRATKAKRPSHLPTGHLPTAGVPTP